MGISLELFYTPTILAILPMGFCYPGTGKSGDLSPRHECASQWRNAFNMMENIQLTLIIGKYVQDWHLGASQKSNLTETVKAWKEY